MRLQAVKAEADRKARQLQKVEVGLPTLHETQPLTKDTDEIYVDEGDKIVAYRPVGSASPPTVNASAPPSNAAYARQGGPGGPRRQPSQPQPYASGYAQAAPGTRAVDDYYNPRRQPSGNTYPPQRTPQSPPMPQAGARRQASGRTQASGYAPSAAYNNMPPPGAAMPAPPAGLPVPGTTAQYGSNQYGHDQYASAVSGAPGYGQHSRSTTCEYPYVT